MSPLYYCPQHTPGVDPQVLEMNADVYGWKLVECPHDHVPVDWTAGAIPAVEFLLVAFLYFCLPALLCAASNWRPAGTLKTNQ